MTTKPISAPNVMLEGPGGTGKTDSIGTLCAHLDDVFYLDLENSLESLIKHFTRQGKPVPANLHWHKIEPPKRTFADFAKSALSINTLDMKTLANMADPNRHKHNLFIKIVEAFADFPDDRTGKKFGPVDSWGPNRAVVMDGLTGLSTAAMSAVVGAKPIRSQQDWGVAMDQVEAFLRMICDNCPCWFILISHVEREVDEVLGGVKLYPATLGRKLAPKITPMFSDVILTVREGTTWTWDTANSQADLKARNLPWQAKQPPDFGPLVAQWKKNVEASKLAEGGAP